MGKKFRINRSRRRLLADWIIIAVILALLMVVYNLSQESDNLTGIARVIDGDTVQISGHTVRLSGIDAPERRQRCNGPQGAYGCGKNASRHLRAMIGRKSVICQGWQYDIYDRLLAVCRSTDEKMPQTSLNARMVLDGWAVSWYDYANEEKAAKAAQRGIWAGDFIMPANWRASHGRHDDSEVAIVKSIWNWLKGLALEVFS